MPRRGKAVSQLDGGGPAKRSSGITSPTAASPSAAPPPPPTGPWWPGCGGSSGGSTLATATTPPQAPPPPPTGPWWPGSVGSNGGGTSSAAANPWGHPVGGYVNLLQQPYFPPFGENFHFVGLTKNLSPTSPAPPPNDSKNQTSPVSINIDVNDGVEAIRSVKKRYWSHDEEASAWLNTSKDPIHGNDKKSDSFWGQITKEFNKDTQPDRVRDTNQLKIHWTRLSKMINEFNGYWNIICKMNKSGYSDEQLMDEAQQMFQRKHGKPFSLVHWWRILKNEPKWCTFVAQSEKEKNKAINVDGTDDKDKPRPIGRDAAKAECRGKRKAEQVMDGIVILGENISKIVEVTQERKKEREKVTEAQLEISKNNLEVAKEQKEAKFLEAYNSLVAQDISHMSQEAKARREKTLWMMEKKIFGDDYEP